jgi:hypothetical protein
MVALKYLEFKKHVNPYAHVRVFNSIVKVNVKTFKKYIINEFSYTLKNKTLNWCHNYMLKYPNCIFLELTHAFCKCHGKIDEQVYMELKNMKHEETEKVKFYYEWIQKLAHGLQVLTINNFLITMFKAILQSYFIITTRRIKWSTLQ